MDVSSETLVDRIYEAALFPELWPSVLQSLDRVADGTGATLLTRRSDAWVGWKLSPSAMSYEERYFASGAATASRTTTKLIAANRAGFAADHEVMGEEEFLNDPLIRDFGSALGLHRAAATAILVPGGDVAVLHIWRHAGRPRFSPDDLARLDAFRPHLARAAMLAARLRLERMQAHTHALELLGIPAAVLDQRGRVVTANRLLQKMDSHVVWLPGERLGLVDRSAGAMLRTLCERADSTGAAVGRSFAARGASGEEPIVIHVAPLKGNGRELFDGGLFLLAVNRVGAAAPDSSLLQGLFDLTAAEARVGAGLLDGMSAADLSQRHDVSLATIRSQVRALLNKSGVSRQSEFIAKLRGMSLSP